MSDGTSPRQLDDRTIRAILDEYFATRDLEAAIEEVASAEIPVEAVFEQMRRSDVAQRHFDRLAVTDRGLDGSEGKLPASLDESGPFERDFDDAVFEARLDDMLEAEPGSQADGGRPGAGESTVVSLFGSSRGAVATLAAAALTALVAGTVLYQQTGAPGGDEFQPRSSVGPSDGAGFTRPDLELFCARRTGDGVRFRGGSETPPGDMECPVAGELKLGYRNRDPELAYAAFFGVDRSGDIYWYGPSPAVPKPVPVESSRETMPVGETIRLSVNHSPGPVRVHAVFTSEPVDHTALKRRLRHKSDRELWESPHLEFERWPTASTSEIFRVTEGPVDEESR